MDRDQYTRHHGSPSFADTLPHDSWIGDAGDASFPDSAAGFEPSWGLYSDDFNVNATVQRSPSATQESSDSALYTPHSPNALGLDISLGSDYLPVPFSYGIGYPDHHIMHTPSPGTLRLPLPQIITNDLHPSPRDIGIVSGLHSPSDPSMAAIGPHYPQSAGTSTPSSTGHGSLPMTPAPLPNTSRPHLQIPTPTAMYSPGSTYINMRSAASTPTKSPLLHASATSPATSPMHIRHTSSPYVVPVQRASVSQVLDVASSWPGAEFLVPQRVYRPNTQSDRRRYVEEVDLEQPILFFMTNPDGLGINCKDALNSRFSRLHGRDDQMFQNRGPSVSIRINWPGYTPWSRQIPTRDFRSPPGPITRAKLAKNVAKTVQRFLEHQKDKTMEDEADSKYKVNNIAIEQIEIVGLQHVSMGSWQAHLRLRPRT